VTAATALIEAFRTGTVWKQLSICTMQVSTNDVCPIAQVL